MPDPIGVGIVGVGAIAEYVHVPGVRCSPGARLVAIADPNRDLLDRRQCEWDIPRTYEDPLDLIHDDEVDAVILCTPNHLHAPLALAAARAGKHILCEKPLALNLDEAREMLVAVSSAGVAHMTAFTYRFVPAMRYLKHLVDAGHFGTIRHFRSQRFQDWPETSLGWRQYRRLAGSGELADMASHRIDFGHHLVGPIAEVCGALKQFVPRDRDAEGNPVPPSDTDDWCSFLAFFEGGATGVFESTKLASGRGSGGKGHDFVEINGSEGSGIYELRHPYRVLLARKEGEYREVTVPREFWKLPEAQRSEVPDDPERDWRWDQDVAFLTAIRERRLPSPSFTEGLRCQAVMEAVLRSWQERRWCAVASDTKLSR